MTEYERERGRRGGREISSVTLRVLRVSVVNLE